jgi:hypothetical protein
LDTDTPPDTSGSLCPPDHSDLLVIVNKSDGTSTAADKAFYVQVD